MMEMSSPLENGPTASRRRLMRFLYVLLTLAVLALAPYQRRVMSANSPNGTDWVELIGVWLLQAAFLLLLAWIGVRLGDSIGLGARDFQRWLDREPGAARALRDNIVRGLLAGAPMGVGALALTNFWDPTPRVEIPTPTVVESILAAFGAGVSEEVGSRLFAMTLFVWLLARRRRPHVPATALWIGNALAATAFGALHVPQAYLFFDVTLRLVAFIIIVNGTVGMVCGWLYHRRGLAAAMAAHFSTDIVLHAIGPHIPGYSA